MGSIFERSVSTPRLEHQVDLRHYSGYGFCRTALACRDQNQHLHETVIDLLASALDDEYILVPNRSLDADRSFSIAEFFQVNFRFGGAQTFADCVDQKRMGGARENLDASHSELLTMRRALKGKEQREDVDWRGCTIESNGQYLILSDKIIIFSWRSSC